MRNNKHGCDKMTRTVVVTGGSAGVGRATAERFAAAGYAVGLIARGTARLEAAAEEIRKAGGRALACPADVADAAAVEGCADSIASELGPIDVWINAAMATIFGPVRDISPGEFRRATEVTYLGTVHGTMAALRHMKQRDQGVVVQVGSALAYRSIPLQAPYCAAKHAVVGFTDSLRSELFHDKSNIRITVVHLPAVNTPQFDWGRNKMPHRPQPVPPIYQPEVAADAIYFAAEKGHRELWLGWPTVKAIIGQKLFPGLLDRYLARSAYSGQQTSETALERSDNLFTPVEGAYGAHGKFDSHARDSSSEIWLRKRAPYVLGSRIWNWALDRFAL